MRFNKLPPPYDYIEDNEIDMQIHRADLCARKRATIPFNWPLMAAVGAFIILMSVFISSCAYSATVPYNDKNAILAIIGEAEGESMAGKIAVARTILNRGTLKGIYGTNSKRVRNHLYTNKTYRDAKRAWEFAKEANNSPDMAPWTATGWGNAWDLELFKQTAWFGRCHITDHVGAHWFYNCEEKG